MVLDWNDVAGDGVTYEIQQKIVKRFWPDEWKTLLEGFTVSSVVIGGLEFGKSYEHRVGAFRGNQEAWSESYTTEVPIPFVGHQADHTVKYGMGVLPVALRPSPAASAVIAAAIDSAVDAWNKAVFYVVTPPPHVLFCTGDDCMTSSVDRNTDGRTVTIYAGAVSCGITAACVGPADGSELTGYIDEEGHMKDLLMVIEEPARMGSTRYYWTNDPDLHRKRLSDGSLQFYLPAVLMHEFGHAAGLHDLYLYGPGKGKQYSGHVMRSPEYEKRGEIVPHTSVPDKDIDHLHDVYRNHTPHPTAD